MMLHRNDINTLDDEYLVHLVREEESSEAFHELLSRYRKLIYSIAGKIFHSQNIRHAFKYDAVMEGESALGLAIMNYDSSKGDFSKYVTICIRGAILNYVNSAQSMVTPLSRQRMLVKAKNAINEMQKNGEENISVENLTAYLVERYPDESAYWQKHARTIFIDASRDMMDILLDDGNDRHNVFHEVIGKNDNIEQQVIAREAIQKLRDIVTRAWMQVIRSEASGGNRRGLEILYRYYCKGEQKEHIVQWLDSQGVKGYELFRQAKSREIRKVCGRHQDIFRDMVNELRETLELDMFDGNDDDFCQIIIDFFNALADSGIMMVETDA